MIVRKINVNHAALPFGMVIGARVDYVAPVQKDSERSWYFFRPRPTQNYSVTADMMLAPISPCPSRGTFYVLDGEFENDFLAVTPDQASTVLGTEGVNDKIVVAPIAEAGVPAGPYMIMGTPFFSGEISVHNCVDELAPFFALRCAMAEAELPNRILVMQPTLRVVTSGEIERFSLSSNFYSDMAYMAAMSRLLDPELVAGSSEGAPSFNMQAARYSVRLNDLVGLSGLAIESASQTLGSMKVGDQPAIEWTCLPERAAQYRPSLIPMTEAGVAKWYAGLDVTAEWTDETQTESDVSIALLDLDDLGGRRAALAAMVTGDMKTMGTPAFWFELNQTVANDGCYLHLPLMGHATMGLIQRFPIFMFQ